MSIDFKDLGKHLRELEAFVAAINSSPANIEVDAVNPASIEAAMAASDNHIDQAASRYFRNSLVKDYADAAKINFREQILEKMASLRLENKEKIDMTSHNEVLDHLSEITETVLELQAADYQTIQRPMSSLARLIHSSTVSSIVDQITENIDLENWLQVGYETRGGMVGSAILPWPDNIEDELGLSVLLIDQMAKDSSFMRSFSSTFYYAGSQHTATFRKMVGGVIIPFNRKFARYVKAKLQISSSQNPEGTFMNTINITNSQVGAVQTGASSVAHVGMNVSQKHVQLAETLSKLADQLKQVENIPGHDKEEILELIEDSRSELGKDKPSKSKLSAFLPMILTAAGLITDVGSAVESVRSAAATLGFAS